MISNTRLALPVAAENNAYEGNKGCRGQSHLHPLNDVLSGQAFVIDALASPEDLGGNHIVRALPLQLLHYQAAHSAI